MSRITALHAAIRQEARELRDFLRAHPHKRDALLFLVATTAITVAWTWYSLATEPNVPTANLSISGIYACCIWFAAARWNDKI